MKKFLMFLCAMTLVFGMVGSASATLFSLDSYDVTLNESEPGLVLFWNSIVTTKTANLEVGEFITFGLFELGTLETSVDGDDKDWENIIVAFDFSSPDVDTDGSGWTTGTVSPTDVSTGIVLWNNPIEFSFGSTGLFTICLENDMFDTPGSTFIDATLTYVRADSAPVPEPSTILLLGSGLLGLVGYNRKRFSKKS